MRATPSSLATATTVCRSTKWGSTSRRDGGAVIEGSARTRTRLQQFVHDEVTQLAQDDEVGGIEFPRLAVHHAQGAHDVAVGQHERRAGVETKPQVAGDEGVVMKAFVEGRV